MNFPQKGPSKYGFDGNYPPILLWTPGKTGQTSVQEMLIKAKCPNVLSIHSLAANTKSDGLLAPNSPERQRRKDSILKYFDSHDNIRIVTTVRDVIRRNISSYFYSYHNRTYESFVSTFNHMWYLDWFDNEIKRYTGLDIYDYSFDVNQKWGIFNKGKFSLIVLRTENLYEGLVNACRLWGIHIGTSVIANRQGGGNAYIEFGRNKFDKSLIRKLYEHKHMNFFYSKKEVDKYISHWCKK